MTIEFNGTGGLMEGDFGTADINVNLDIPYTAIHETFGSGTPQTITIPHDNDLDGSSAYTFMAWVKSSATSATTGDGGTGNASFATIAQINDSWKFGIHDSGKPYFFWYGSSTVSEYTWGDAFTLVGAGWTHVCVVVNTSGGTVNGHANNTATLYQNGVARSGTLTVGGNCSDEGGNILIHSKAYNDEILYGNIMDVKLYNAILSADEVKVAASKINIDSTTVSSTAPQIWAKLNTGATGSVASAIGGTATVGSGFSDTNDYDAFSVKAQSISPSTATTTDGTLTVTQGKLECLDMSNMNFDGINDYIDFGDSTAVDGLAQLTTSCWMIREGYETGSTERTGWLNKDDALECWVRMASTSECGMAINNDHRAFTGFEVTADKWVHVVMTYEGTSVTGGANDRRKLYFDGVLQDTEESGSQNTINNTATNLHIGGRGATYSFDGKLRDVRIYDKALSADQIASLYSGTYNTTPKHWWNLDQGTWVVNNIYDTGTGTAVTGNASGATYQNGTLDLDNTVRIETNGTLSAPRGTMQVTGASSGINWMVRNGTFTHNNGTVDFIAPTSNASCILSSTMTGANAFYDLHATTTTWLRIDSDIDIHHEAASGYVFWTYGGVVTMGTDDYASGTDNSDNCIGYSYIYGRDGNTYLYGANQLKPYRLKLDTGTHYWINSGHNSYMGDATHVKWGNMSGELTMAGTADAKLKIMGDMEFDAVTVGDGDTLDLNGQRVVIGGIESLGTGVIDATNSLVYLNARNDGYAYRIHDSGTFTHTGSTFVVDSASDPGCQMQSAVGEPGENNTFHNIMFLRDCNLNGGELKASGFVKVATNDLATADNNITAVDVTIPTDGVLTAGSSTITASGDFNTSGGLIGRSAGDFVTDDGGTNHNYILAGSAANSDSWTNITVECWVKLDHMGRMGSESTFFSRGSNSLPKVGTSSSNTARLYGGSSSKALNGNTTLTTDKWYHLAYTYNNSTGAANIYVDGKLDASAIIDASIMTADVGASMVGAQQTGNRAMDGLIGKISIWNHELTLAEIRTLMFLTGEEMVAHSDFSSNKNDCKFFYNFDEGTGATITDSGPGGNNGTWGHNNSGTAAVWAEAGTLTWTGGSTPSAGTLDMTGAGGTTMRVPDATKFFNLTCGDNSAGGIVTIVGTPYIYGTFTADKYNPVRSGQFGISGTATPVVTNGATFEDIQTFIYQSGSTQTACGTTYNILRPSASSTVLLGGNTIATTLQTDGGTQFRPEGYDLKTKTVAMSSTVNINKGSSFIFTDESACGFGSSSGTLNCIGSASTGFFNSFGNQVQPCVEVTEGIGRRWGFAGTDGKSFAVSFWIKREVGATEGYIISTVYQPFNIRWSGRYLNLQFDVGTSGHVGETLVSTSTALSATNDTWEHVVVSYRDDTKEAKFYVNGSLDSTRTTSGTVKEENVDTLLIGHYGGGTNSAQANLADVRLFEHSNQHCLDATAVTALYNSGSNPATNGEVYVADNAGDVPGALGWWKLNEDSIGRTYDFSGNMHNGVNRNIYNGTDDPSARFNGTNSYVDCGTGADLELTNNYSISLWCKNDDASGRSINEHLIAKYTGSDGDRGYRVTMSTDNRINFESGNSGGIGSSVATYDLDDHTIPVNQWNHVLCTYASGVMKIFINGTERRSTDNSGTQTTTYNPTAEKLVIGAYEEGGGGRFDGEIADVRLYDVVLNGTDITALAGQGSTTTPVTSSYVLTTSTSGAEPVAWWKLGEQFEAIDSSGGTKREGISHSGGNPDRINIMSEKSQALPTNKWDFDTSMPVTSNYTTFAQYDQGKFVGAINITNSTFQDATGWSVEIGSGATITAFNNNTINRSGLYGNGLYALRCDKAHTAFDNIVISGDSDGTYGIYANNVVLEFDNSTFDVAEVDLNSSGAVLSKNHTNTGSGTVANDCRMILHTKRNNDGFSDTLSGQNVTLTKIGSYNPNLAISESRSYGGFIIPTGSKITHEAGWVVTVAGETNITGSYEVGTGGDAPTATANLITGALTLNSGGVFQAPPTTTIGNAAPSTPVGTRNMYVPTGATFTHNNGLLKFTGANNVCLSHTPAAGAGHKYYDIEVDASGTVTYTDVENDRPFYIENDLTIASGSTFTNQGDDDLFQCDGTIHCNGTLNTSVGGNFTFNNLTISTGGTYNATDETTTITGAYRNTGGTFTAN